MFVATRAKLLVFPVPKDFSSWLKLSPMALSNLSIYKELQDCDGIWMANACNSFFVNELSLGFLFIVLTFQ